MAERSLNLQGRTVVALPDRMQSAVFTEEKSRTAGQEDVSRLQAKPASINHTFESYKGLLFQAAHGMPEKLLLFLVPTKCPLFRKAATQMTYFG